MTSRGQSPLTFMGVHLMEAQVTCSLVAYGPSARVAFLPPGVVLWELGDPECGLWMVRVPMWCPAGTKLPNSFGCNYRVYYSLCCKVGVVFLFEDGLLPHLPPFRGSPCHNLGVVADEAALPAFVSHRLPDEW